MDTGELLRWPETLLPGNLLGGWGAWTMSEDDEEIEVQVDLPGAQKEDVSLSAKDGSLQICASRSDGTDHRKQQIRRQIPIPNIQPDSLEAKLENGVLEICARRAESSEEITIK